MTKRAATLTERIEKGQTLLTILAVQDRRESRQPLPLAGAMSSRAGRVWPEDALPPFEPQPQHVENQHLMPSTHTP